MPAFATACYTVATINNSFEYDLNPMVGLLDSHVRILIFLKYWQGMSLILSSFLMLFMVTFGQEAGFLAMMCYLIACIPFFFDGALSIISISKQRVLTGYE